MLVSEEIGNFRIPPAALIESTEGATNCPSLSRLIWATPRPLVTAKSKERYPMAPSVWLMPAATPSFPSPPAPTWLAQSELSVDSHEVNTLVVPDSSER